MQPVRAEPHRLRVRDAFYGLILSSFFGGLVTVWRLWGELDGLGSLSETDIVNASFGPAIWGMGATALFQMFWIFYVGVTRNADPVRHFGIGFEAQDVYLGIGGYLLVLGGSWIIFNWIFPDFGADASGIESQFPIGFIEVPEQYLLALILTVGIVVPFVEEVFFRGMAMRALERGFGLGWAVVGSAIVFGLAHYAGGVRFESFAIVAFATWAGLVFGALAAYTGRIAAPTLAHMLNNTIVMLAVTSAI